MTLTVTPKYNQNNHRIYENVFSMLSTCVFSVIHPENRKKNNFWFWWERNCGIFFFKNRMRVVEAWENENKSTKTIDCLRNICTHAHHAHVLFSFCFVCLMNYMALTNNQYTYEANWWKSCTWLGVFISFSFSAILRPIRHVAINVSVSCMVYSHIIVQSHLAEP